MTDLLTYDDHIAEAYLKCLRSVLIVDDDYPTLDGLLKAQMKGTEEASAEPKLLADPEGVLEIVRGFRTQDPPLIVDIHDGTNIHAASELKVAEHLHQSDLLVLDFCLDKSRKDDGSKAIQILRKLAKSSHFNLVMMHSSLEPAEVFEQVALGLLSNEVDFGFSEHHEAVLANFEEADPDLLVQLRTDLFQDNAAYLEARKNPTILSEVAQLKRHPFSSFSGRCDEKRVDLETRAHLLAALLTERNNQLTDKLWDDNDVGRVNFSSASSEIRWVKLNTVFIGFTKKRENADLLADLKLALSAWHPQPSRLMLKKFLVELDERGATAESLALGTKYASAIWYHDLLGASPSERGARLSETISRHVQALMSVIEPEVLKFATSFIGLEDASMAIKVCDDHYGVNLGDRKDKALAVNENNLLVSTMPFIRGEQLQTGHIFKFLDQYWVCLSPACDLVPGRAKPARREVFGDKWLPFLAVRLVATSEDKAAKKATDKRFIYLLEEGTIKYFCINSADNPESFFDWHTFIARDNGQFDPGTRTLKFMRNSINGDDMLLSQVDAEVVGQLRYTYAVNLAQELSRWLGRIGLDYLKN